MVGGGHNGLVAAAYLARNDGIVGSSRPGIGGEAGTGVPACYLPVMNSLMDSGRFTMRTSPIQPWKTWSMAPLYS